MRSEEDALPLQGLKGLVVDGLHPLGLQSFYLLIVMDDVTEAVELSTILCQLLLGMLDGIDYTEAKAGLLVYFYSWIHWL